MKLYLSILSTLFISVYCNSQGIKQGYNVKGILMCGKNPATDVQVKLVDDDFGPDADDVLDSAFTNNQGFFQLRGVTTERTTIDPHLKIYHDCNDGKTVCQRRWNFELPDAYIVKGIDLPKTLDIGTWNLESLLPGESRDCEH